MDEERGMFCGKTVPDEKSAWALYEKGLDFNAAINLNDTVRVNENFYIGK